MEKIMERPGRLDEKGVYARHYEINYWNGWRVKSMFYGRGYPKENYIPEELEKRGWVPDDGKMYKCWWYYTNPADPADPGEDILVYIEEMDEEKEKDVRGELEREIVGKICKLGLDDLRRLGEMMKKFF